MSTPTSPTAAVDALVGVLRTIETGRPSALGRSAAGTTPRCCGSPTNLGIALSTDGVGSKLVVAEQADRLETVGIDCVAMNVNDLICVGAEPIAMLDYLAVEQADPERARRGSRTGLKVGAEAAGVEIPGGELAVLPELIRGHPSPHGFDLCGTAHRHRRARRDRHRRRRIAPGDALIGLPSSGLHSNGYTLARRALLEEGGLALDDTPAELGGATVADALLEPTVIYVRAVARPAALRAPRPRPGPHHRRRPAQPAAPRRRRRLRDRGAAAGPADLRRSSRARGGDRPDAEMWDVFNMGCGFVAVVPEDQRRRGRRAARRPPRRRAGASARSPPPRAGSPHPGSRSCRATTAPARRGRPTRRGGARPPAAPPRARPRRAARSVVPPR